MAEEENTKPPPPPASVGCCGVRHWQILLHFSFYVIIIAMDVSLSATLPAMLVTNPKLGSISHGTISQMFMSYTLAFIVTELFGGYICKRFGFRWPMMIFMGVICAVTLNFQTIGNEYGAGGIIFCRAVQGICSGLLFAMPAEAINRWSPIRERTTFGTTVYAGGILGNALAMFMGSYLSSNDLKYSFINTHIGYAALIWVVLMAMYGADSPEQYPKEISQVELDYIVNNRGNVTTSKTVKIPWGKIFTSMPFWAIVVAQIGAGWMFYVLVVNVPMYLRMNYQVAANSSLIAVINLITWVLSFAISGIAQMLINEERTSIGQSRKIFNTIGTCIPAIFFLYLTFGIQGNQYVGVALWVIVSVSSVGTICGSKLNCNDITTNFSSIVYGIATWISLMFNIISSIILNSHGFDNWNVVFISSGILVLCTSLFYLKFASGEEQEWDYVHENLGDEEMDLSKSTSRSEVDEKKYLLFIRKQ